MEAPGAGRACWVGLGGNIGDVGSTFASALLELDAFDGWRLRRCSRHYRTPAWGVTGQADFLNAVAEFTLHRAPLDALADLQAIERRHGRQRDREVRWGPRTLDLDLLAIEGLSADSAALQLPHPRLAERAFVLVPWAEIAPGLEIPGVGRVEVLRDALDRSGIEAIP